MNEKPPIELRLMNTDFKQEDEQLGKQQTPNALIWNEFEYKEFGNAPKITLAGITLVLLTPILLCMHIRVSQLIGISIVQFAFVTTLIAFITNYTAIIRKYELMPFLPENVFDETLKRICVCAVIGMILSMFIGWNGSGGIIFAIIWELIRGNRMGFYWYLLMTIIIGSIMMEESYTYRKLLEFIPGILFGYVNSTLFTLQESSVYAIAHQFLLLCTVILPMTFPSANIISPSIWQWLIMVACGFSFLPTLLLTIKAMQSERVSVVMGVISGVMMVGTSFYGTTLDIIGSIIIAVGVALLIRKQYFDLQY